MNATQLDAVWKKWCEFRLASRPSTIAAEAAADPINEKHILRKLLTRAENAAEQAVWLRSLVEVCGLTIRQVSTYFQIEPQVVVRAISLLSVPAGIVNRDAQPKRVRRFKAA